MAVLTNEYQYLGRSAKIAPQSGSYGYYILLYGKSDPDIATGYHTVSVKQVLACTINSQFYQFGTSFSGKIGGVTVFSGNNKPSAAWELGSFTEGGYSYKKGTVIAEASASVDCTDGLAKSIPLYCTWTFNVNGDTYTPSKGAVGSVSVTATLPAIARASTVTATDAYIGAASTVIINKSNAAYTHTLSYKMAGQSAWTELVSGTAASQYGFTVPESAYTLIPDNKDIKIYIRCETFNGSVSMGTNETSLTAYVRESENLPEVSASAADVNPLTLALTGDALRVVKGFSDLRVQTSASARNGASVSSVRVVCGGKSGIGTDVTLNGAESNTVTVTVTDSRGFPGTASVSGLTLVDYIPLTLNPTVARESSGSDTVSISGTGKYFSGSFGAVSNTLTVKARAKPDGGGYGDYTELSVTVSGDGYTVSGTLSGVSYTAVYDIEVTAYDAVYTAGKSASYRINKGVPVFDWGEHDFAFHVPASIPLEAPPVLTGTGTNDSAMNSEILSYALSSEDGYLKFVYIPASSHGTFGSFPFLAEAFKHTEGSEVRIWFKASTQTAYPYVKEYGATYRTNLGFAGWFQTDRTGIVTPSVSSLWSGTLNDTAATVNLGSLGNYNEYIVVGCPKAGASFETLVIPKPIITTTATEYQMADETNYVVFSIYYSGSTVYLKWVRASGTSSKGYISRVIGKV